MRNTEVNLTAALKQLAQQNNPSLLKQCFDQIETEFKHQKKGGEGADEMMDFVTEKLSEFLTALDLSMFGNQYRSAVDKFADFYSEQLGKGDEIGKLNQQLEALKNQLKVDGKIKVENYMEVFDAEAKQQCDAIETNINEVQNSQYRFYQFLTVLPSKMDEELLQRCKRECESALKDLWEEIRILNGSDGVKLGFKIERFAAGPNKESEELPFGFKVLPRSKQEESDELAKKWKPINNLCKQYNATKELHSTLTVKGVPAKLRLARFKNQVIDVKQRSDIKPTNRFKQFFHNIERLLSSAFPGSPAISRFALLSNKSITESFLSSAAKEIASVAPVSAASDGYKPSI